MASAGDVLAQQDTGMLGPGQDTGMLGNPSLSYGSEGEWDDPRHIEIISGTSLPGFDQMDPDLQANIDNVLPYNPIDIGDINEPVFTPRTQKAQKLYEFLTGNQINDVIHEEDVEETVTHLRNLWVDKTGKKSPLRLTTKLAYGLASATSQVAPPALMTYYTGAGKLIFGSILKGFNVAASKVPALLEMCSRIVSSALPAYLFPIDTAAGHILGEYTIPVSLLISALGILEWIRRKRVTFARDTRIAEGTLYGVSDDGDGDDLPRKHMDEVILKKDTLQHIEQLIKDLADAHKDKQLSDLSKDKVKAAKLVLETLKHKINDNFEPNEYLKILEYSSLATKTILEEKIPTVPITTISSYIGGPIEKKGEVIQRKIEESKIQIIDAVDKMHAASIIIEENRLKLDNRPSHSPEQIIKAGKELTGARQIFIEEKEKRNKGINDMAAVLTGNFLPGAVIVMMFIKMGLSSINLAKTTRRAIMDYFGRTIGWVNILITNEVPRPVPQHPKMDPRRPVQVKRSGRQGDIKTRRLKKHKEEDKKRKEEDKKRKDLGEPYKTIPDKRQRSGGGSKRKTIRRKPVKKSFRKKSIRKTKKNKRKTKRMRR